MGLCCEECFAERFIKKFICEQNENADCEYCGTKDSSAADITLVGDFLREGLSRAYENMNSSGLRRDYFDGESVSEIVNHHEHVFSEKLYSLFKDEELLNDLISESGPDHLDYKDGEVDWLDGGAASLVTRDEFYGPDHNRFSLSWEEFKWHVKHFMRFFDSESDITTRAALLGPLTELIEKVVTTIPAGTKLWRARKGSSRVEPKEPLLLQSAIGPAPVEKSGHSRMSPAGISYLYLGDKPETCIAEIRPRVGSNVWLGKFELIKNMKIVDLSLVPNIEVGSIFDPGYEHDMYWARTFMDNFTYEISRPYDKEEFVLDYVPTQLLSEFFRSQGFEGIKFASSQFKDGYNYTLFLGPADDGYPDEYRPETSIPEFREYMYLNYFNNSEIRGMNAQAEIMEEQTFQIKELEVPIKEYKF